MTNSCLLPYPDHVGVHLAEDKGVSSCFEVIHLFLTIVAKGILQQTWYKLALVQEIYLLIQKLSLEVKNRQALINSANQARKQHSLLQLWWRQGLRGTGSRLVGQSRPHHRIVQVVFCTSTP